MHGVFKFSGGGLGVLQKKKMTITYKLDETDLQQFYRFHYWYSPDKKWFRIRRRLYSASLTYAIAFFLLWVDIKDEKNASVAPLLIICLALFVVMFFISKYTFLFRIEKSIEKILREGKNKDVFGNQVVELQDDKIITRTENSQSAYNLDVIEKIREDDNAFYVYTSSLQAIVIPKRAVTSENTGEFEKWIAKLD